MTPGLLIRKTSTSKATQNLDLSYLDETSSQKTRRNNDKGMVRSLQYLTKEQLGQVHAGGFLHTELLKMTQPGEPGPCHLPNELRKTRINKAIHRHNKTYGTPGGVAAHKGILSMSTHMHQRLLSKGLDPDTVLVSAFKQVMNRFRVDFHKGDRIGYAFGIHHDTDNLHLHFLLLPTTEKGRRVGFSQQLKKRQKSPSRHRNQLQAVSRYTAAEEKKWWGVLNDPQKVQQLASQRNGHKFFHLPRRPEPEKYDPIFHSYINRRYYRSARRKKRLKRRESLESSRRAYPLKQAMKLAPEKGFFEKMAQEIFYWEKRKKTQNPGILFFKFICSLGKALNSAQWYSQFYRSFDISRQNYFNYQPTYSSGKGYRI